MKESISTIDTQPARERMTDGALEEMIARTRMERPVLTLETMGAVKELDALGGDLDRPDGSSVEVTGVIGVFAGIKPACIVTPESLAHADVDLQSFTGIIDAMGLHTRSTDRPDGGQLLMISRHEELAEELNAVWYESRREEMYERCQYKMGALLGYPVTSTAYFLARMRAYEATGEWLEHANQPATTAYTQLIFSPEHYEEEMAAYSTPFEEAVKIIAPRTHLRNEQSLAEGGTARKENRMAKLIGKLHRKSVDSGEW